MSPRKHKEQSWVQGMEQPNSHTWEKTSVDSNYNRSYLCDEVINTVYLIQFT